MPACASLYQNLILSYTYTWVELTNGNSVVNTTKNLLIPPRTLTTNMLHTFQLFVNTSLTNNPGAGQVTSIQNISIMVLPSPLYATIAGGDRSISISSTLLLDGSMSSDPDGTPLSFLWTCTFGGNSCNLGTTFLGNSTLMIPPSLLSIGSSQFVLTISTLDGRNASQTVLIDVMNVTLPTVYIVTPTGTTTINPQDSLKLLGVVTGGTNGSNYIYTWQETSGLPITDPQYLLSTPGSLSFILNSGLLQQGMTYTFRLIVNVTSTIFTQASINIVVNPVPQGGMCQIRPENGTALTTQFNLDCSGWFSPLQITNTLAYSFSYRNLSSSSTIVTLTDTRVTSTATVYLPDGNFMLIGTIFDQSGASVQVLFGPVLVTPIIATNCDVQNYTNTLLVQAETLENSDSMLQLVNIFLQIMLNNTDNSTCNNQSNLELKAALWTSFLNTLNKATHQPEISSTLASQLAQVLIVLTEALFNPDVLNIQTEAQRNDVLSLTIDVLRAIIYSISDQKATSDTVLLVLSKLLETVPCSLMETVLDLISLLSEISVQQDQIPEAFVNFVAPRVNSTAIIADPNGGGLNITTGDLNFTLPPELLQQGSGGSSPLNQAFVSITITRYDNALRRCRATNGIPQGDIISIDLSQLGNTIGVNNLSNPIEFFLPIDNGVTFTKVGCGQLYKLPVCAWWDTNASIWRQDGCHSQGVQTLTNGDRIVKCACNHLTDFAILLNEAKEGACPKTAVSYIVFGLIYVVVGLLALVQTVRILRVLHVAGSTYRSPSISASILYAGKSCFTCQWHPVMTPHLLIILICGLRALGQANVGGVLTFQLFGKAIVIAFPYAIVFWLFTTLVIEWASLIHTGLDGMINKRGVKRLNPCFLVANFLAFGIITVFFIALVTEWELTMIGLICSITFAGLYGTTGFAFLVYGSLVARQLSQAPTVGAHGKRATSTYASAVFHITTCSLAARIQVVALLISLCFLLESCIWAYSVLHTSEILDIVFSCLDLTGLMAILLMFYHSVRRLIREGLPDSPSKSSKSGKSATTKGNRHKALEMSTHSRRMESRVESPSHTSRHTTLGPEQHHDTEILDMMPSKRESNVSQIFHSPSHEETPFELERSAIRPTSSTLGEPTSPI